MSDRAARHVIIRGTVQGVGFRHWTSVTARDLGLSGWVRNRFDGSVEAVFSGLPEAIETMLWQCHRGPPSARVDAVQARDAQPGEADLAGFEQRATV